MWLGDTSSLYHPRRLFKPEWRIHLLDLSREAKQWKASFQALPRSYCTVAVAAILIIVVEDFLVFDYFLPFIGKSYFIYFEYSGEFLLVEKNTGVYSFWLSGKISTYNVHECSYLTARTWCLFLFCFQIQASRVSVSSVGCCACGWNRKRAPSL